MPEGFNPVPVDDPEALIQSIERRVEQPQQFIEHIQSLPLTQLDPAVANSYRDYALNRLRRGQPMLSDTQALYGLLAAQTGQPIIQEPEDKGISLPNIIRGAVSNIRDIGMAIPRLPGAIFNEIREIPNIPEYLRQANLQAENPLQALGNIAAVPGIRFIPGAYTVENLLGTEGGGIGELLRNPVFTGLDLYPAARGIAKMTPQYAARRAELASDFARQALEIQNLGGVSVDVPVPTLPKDQPLRTALSRRVTGEVDQFGVPTTRLTRTGQATENLVRIAGETKPGQLFRSAFGAEARYTQAAATLQTEWLRELLSPQARAELLTGQHNQLLHDAGVLYQKYPSIDKERRLALTQGMQRDFTDTINRIAATPDEIAFATEARDLVALMNQLKISKDLVAEVRINGINETYDIKTGGKILKAQGTRDRIALSNQAYEATRRGVAQADVQSALGAIDQIVNSNISVTAMRPLLEAQLRVLQGFGYDITDVLRDLRKSGKARIQGKILGPGFERRLHHTPGQIPHQNLYTRWQQRASQRYSTRQLNTAQRRMDRIEKASVPARWHPHIEDIIESKAAKFTYDNYHTTLSAEDFGRIMEQTHSNIYHHIPPKEMRQIVREASESWQMLREQGLDPIFVHRVSPEHLAQVSFPNIIPRVTPVRSTRLRRMDFAPYLEDVAVGLRADAIDILRQEGARRFVDEITRRYSRSEEDLTQELWDQATARAQRKGYTDVRRALDEIIQQEWTRWDPESYFADQRVRSFTVQSGRPWIPKSVADNLDRMTKPALGTIGSLFEPATRVFRTALLPLSMRWHVNNLMGGYITTALRTDPFVVMRNWTEARRLLREEGLPAGAPPTGMVSAPLDVQEWGTTASAASKLNVAFSHKAGSQMRKILEDFWEKSGNLVEKSFKFNQDVDTFFRAITYVDAYQKALKRGVDDITAQAYGVAALRKTMVNWDMMTPIERSIMRSVFPFYGWMKFMIDYVMTFPGDHPLRASVLSTFARTEMEDWDTGLPQRFQEMFFLGDMDANGHTKAIALGAANPFRDVSNYFTLQGFMGQVHPAFSTIMETLGIDPISGSQDLYPNMRYNPETGRLEVDKPTWSTFGANLLRNFVPQAGALLNLTGLSGEFRELAEANPAAATRSIFSDFGIPSIYRSIDIPEERLRAELGRLASFQAARREAISEGTSAPISQWSQFGDYQIQLDTLLGAIPQDIDYEALREAVQPGPVAQQPAAQSAYQAQIASASS